jgi:IS30 family transposase
MGCHAQRSVAATPDHLAGFAHSLNNPPGKTLGCMQPSEMLAELLAHTG